MSDLQGETPPMQISKDILHSLYVYDGTVHNM